MGLFKPALRLPNGACEGTLFVAEEFALEELPGKGAAVYWDKRLVPSVAFLMNDAGQKLLPGPRLAKDQNIGIKLGDLLHGSDDRTHVFAHHDKFWEKVWFYLTM